MSNESPSMPWPRRLLNLLLLSVLALLVLHVLFQVATTYIWPGNHQVYEFSNRFDVDDEDSVPTWFSQFLLLLVAVMSFWAARISAAAKTRFGWYLVALMGLTFSIDEVATLHEKVLESVHVEFFGLADGTMFRNAWIVILPIMIPVVLGLLDFWKGLLPARTWRLLVLGLAVFASGARGIESFNFTLNRDAFFYQAWGAGLEEGLEMLGAAILVYAVADYIDRNLPEKVSLMRSALQAE